MLKMDGKWWEVGLDLGVVGPQTDEKLWETDGKWWEVGGAADGWEMVDDENGRVEKKIEVVVVDSHFFRQRRWCGVVAAEVNLKKNDGGGRRDQEWLKGRLMKPLLRQQKY
uniref:Uncharacterized protein n=1 Tax=Solanum lycopersicum TaxID=4081 RepID=A0A3Q7EAJ9_SOLLC